MKNKVVTAIGIGIAAAMAPGFVVFAAEGETASEPKTPTVTGEVNVPEDVIEQANENGGNLTIKENNDDLVEDKDNNDRLDVEVYDAYGKVESNSIREVTEDTPKTDEETEVAKITITDEDVLETFESKGTESDKDKALDEVEEKIKNIFESHSEKYDDIKIEYDSNYSTVNVTVEINGEKKTFTVNDLNAGEGGSEARVGSSTTPISLDELKKLIEENPEYHYVYDENKPAVEEKAGESFEFDDEQKARNKETELKDTYKDVSFTSAGTRIKNAEIEAVRDENGKTYFAFKSGTRIYTVDGVETEEDLTGKTVKVETETITDSQDGSHSNIHDNEVLSAIIFDGVRYQIYNNDDAAEKAIQSIRKSGPSGIDFDETKDKEIPWVWNFEQNKDLFTRILKTDSRFDGGSYETFTSQDWKNLFGIVSAGDGSYGADRLTKDLEGQLWDFHSNVKGEFLAYRYFLAEGQDGNLIDIKDPELIKQYEDSGLLYKVKDKDTQTEHNYLILGQYDPNKFQTYNIGDIASFGDKDYIVTGIWRSAQCGNLIKDMLFVKESLNVAGTTAKYTVVASKEEALYDYSVYKNPLYVFTAIGTVSEERVYVGVIPTPQIPDIPVTPPPTTPENPSVPTTPTPDTPVTTVEDPVEEGQVLGAVREAELPQVLGARRARTSDETRTATRALAMASAAAVIGLLGISLKKRKN